MKTDSLGVRSLIGAVLMSFLQIGTSLPGHAATPQSVQLSPGDNIQAAVNAAPAGTTFILLAGVYRMQSVAPKQGDIFKGQGSVDLNGSQLLSLKPDSDADGLWVATATASTYNHGTCEPAYPLCGYTQDLFIDGQVQSPVNSTKGLMPGSWYFDRAANQVYVPTNPAGHVIELGMSLYAFYGNASNVQIFDMTVEKYANPAQEGAVGGNRWTPGLGAGWIVNNVESRWNHGTGITLGTNSQILNSYIHHNGQLGIGFYMGTDCKAINNEISWNNYAGYLPGWEAGGSKFWSTTNLLVQSNYVHDNNGPGLWTDFDNVGVLYENNNVVNNLNVGILHEISYDAIIRNNTLKGNGAASTGYLGNAQIRIMNSSKVDVYGNILEVGPGGPDAAKGAYGGGNGIALINQVRGSGREGPWWAANNYVHNNTITYLGVGGGTGLENDGGGDTATGNHFDYNHYIVKNGGTIHWEWGAWKTGEMTWAEFKASGQEPHGSCCD